MKTKEEIQKEIEKYNAELTNTMIEREKLLKHADYLLGRINYLSGKIDLSKELTTDE